MLPVQIKSKVKTGGEIIMSVYYICAVVTAISACVSLGFALEAYLYQSHSLML